MVMKVCKTTMTVFCLWCRLLREFGAECERGLMILWVRMELGYGRGTRRRPRVWRLGDPMCWC